MVPDAAGTSEMEITMRDTKGREITYLRLSVTELCNLRCRYCMPPEGIQKRRHEEMLTQEEMLDAVETAASIGIRKVRVTGGEPLVKKNILEICRGIRRIPGIEELCITTNGIRLPQMAADLRQAGVDRVNLSLDTLDPERYRQITRGGRLEDALKGLESALAAGFQRVKINAVLLPETDAEEIRKLAGLTETMPVDVRFIERMPMPGNDACGRDDFVSAETVLQALPEAVPVGRQELQEWEKGTVARLYKLPGTLGNVGLISAMSAHFCGTCNRLRLTADGHIRPCLHDPLEFSIKGCTKDEMREQFMHAVREKPCGNPMIFGYGNTARSKDRAAEEGRSMNRIGG